LKKNIERFNATLKSQLCKLQDLDRNNWDRYLLPTIYAYSVGQHRTTKYSPYEIVYGKDPALSFDKPQSIIRFLKPNEYYNRFRRQQQQLNKQRQIISCAITI
jgi:hypothetical protein